MLITASSADELFARGIERLLLNGDVIAPRGQVTRELIGVQLRLRDSAKNVVTLRERKLNYSFMCAEFLWMITGQNRVDLIEPYNKNITMAAAPGEYAFQGAYGVKLLDQLPYVIEVLREDPSSRQAVINIWRERPRPSRDVPCTLSWQFMIRGDALDLVTTMRSNDVWLGTPYDVFNFTMLQQVVATELGLKRGRYVHTAGSFHLYERDQPKAARVLLAAQEREQQNSTPLEHLLSGVYNLAHPNTTLPLPLSELGAVSAVFTSMTVKKRFELPFLMDNISEGWLALLLVAAKRFDTTIPANNGWDDVCSQA